MPRQGDHRPNDGESKHPSVNVYQTTRRNNSEDSHLQEITSFLFKNART
jgi:hypothetical protein